MPNQPASDRTRAAFRRPELAEGPSPEFWILTSGFSPKCETNPISQGKQPKYAKRTQFPHTKCPANPAFCETNPIYRPGVPPASFPIPQLHETNPISGATPSPRPKKRETNPICPTPPWPAIQICETNPISSTPLVPPFHETNPIYTAADLWKTKKRKTNPIYPTTITTTTKIRETNPIPPSQLPIGKTQQANMRNESNLPSWRAPRQLPHPAITRNEPNFRRDAQPSTQKTQNEPNLPHHHHHHDQNTRNKPNSHPANSQSPKAKKCETKPISSLPRASRPNYAKRTQSRTNSPRCALQRRIGAGNEPNHPLVIPAKAGIQHDPITRNEPNLPRRTSSPAPAHTSILQNEPNLPSRWLPHPALCETNPISHAANTRNKPNLTRQTAKKCETNPIPTQPTTQMRKTNPISVPMASRRLSRTPILRNKPNLPAPPPSTIHNIQYTIYNPLPNPARHKNTPTSVQKRAYDKSNRKRHTGIYPARIAHFGYEGSFAWAFLTIFSKTSRCSIIAAMRSLGFVRASSRIQPL